MNKLIKPGRAPDHDILGHWLWVLPALLIVSALSLRQINLYPPTPDEFYSMYSSGWTSGGSYSPSDIMDALAESSPTHSPGYFILLSIWGNLVSHDIAIGRVLGIFFAMLALAVTYRIARDFLAPAAAIFAILILFSNAFLNFYVAHTRMYMLLILMTGCVLWLYLRLALGRRASKRSDYAALGCAAFGLLIVYPFSVVFALTLAIYHLLFVPRSRRWLALALTAGAASLCAAPFYVIVVTEGVSETIQIWSETVQSFGEPTFAWLILITNGHPLLLAPIFVGLALASRRGGRFPKPLFWIAAIQFLLGSALLEFTDYIVVTNLRYLLPAWLVFSLFVAAGLYHLARLRAVAGALILLWVVAGLGFQTVADWPAYIAGRSYAFRHPPWQVLAGLAADSQPPPRIYYGPAKSRHHLDFSYRLPITTRQHYFDRHGLAIISFNDPQDLKTLLANNALVAPRIWIVIPEDDSLQDQFAAMKSTMRGLQYDLCLTFPIGTSWTIMDYSWSILGCNHIMQPSMSRNRLIEHSLYNASPDAGSSKLFFADAWSAVSEFERDNFAFSYQLIAPDWTNIAQLDLPMVHEGSLRRFTIDISDVPAGVYRLVLILYDKRTGQTVDWNDNPGYLPDIMELAEIILE